MCYLGLVVLASFDVPATWMWWECQATQTKSDPDKYSIIHLHIFIVKSTTTTTMVHK